MIVVDMVVLNEELAVLEAELPRLAGAARLVRMLVIAWHLRQRDTARAQRLVAQLEQLLDAGPVPTGLCALVRARLVLIQAEGNWLAGALDQAQAGAGQALDQFARLGDGAGAADAHWLLAWIALDRGDSARGDVHLGQAAQHARTAGDPLRADVADAAAALSAAMSDLPKAEARWGERFAGELALPHAAAAGWISDFFGMRAFQSSDFVRAVRHMTFSYQQALATGQLRRAITLATNIGNALSSLNTHDAALEWMQRALALAQPTGWPLSIGACQAQTAETLRQLNQLEAAQDLLHEALHTLTPLAASRVYAVALEYQGDLALDRADPAAALHSFTLLLQRGAALGQADFQSGARRGQAHALSRMGRATQARAAAGAALALAREHGDAYNQIAALVVLADILVRHDLPAAPGDQAPGTALGCLEQALALADGIDGYHMPSGLLDAAAREYARTGDYPRAYAIAQTANVARDQTHSRVATNRAIAMRLQHQTERAHSESEHHRLLAAAEARRAEVLQRTSATLAHLSAIGQEITAHLDATAVFRALDRHVHSLLDATHFSVFLLETSDADGSQQLQRAFGIEAGQPLPATSADAGDPLGHALRCVAERREIQVDSVPADAAQEDTPQIAGTADQGVAGGPAEGPLAPAAGSAPTAAHSMLFAPLLIGERVLGVMTVQALQPQAYGERERLIFRTLCAYGAIALDNAAAYRQVALTLRALNATQAQLLDKNIELEQAYRALEEVSLTDQLTGLRNRRFFLQHVDAEVALCLRRHEEPLYAGGDDPGSVQHAGADGRDLVFFMVDLDHFKQVNDQYGHAAGDAVLIQMQERLREVFRESDYLVRWGGEEFLVMARATQRADAGLVAERMRRAVADRPFHLPGGMQLSSTCSIGFACFPFLPSQPRLLSWSQVLELADQALYLAKNHSRNAWASLGSTAATQPDGIFTRLLQELAQTLRAGEVQLLRSDGPAIWQTDMPAGAGSQQPV